MNKYKFDVAALGHRTILLGFFKGDLSIGGEDKFTIKDDGKNTSERENISKPVCATSPSGKARKVVVYTLIAVLPCTICTV